MFSKLSAISALAAIASAASIQIDVPSQNSQTAFYPNSVKAAVGDTIVFAFHSSNIAIRQGYFSEPCQPLSGGFFSGYQIQPSTFSVEVRTTDPIFFYSTFVGQCQQGFAGVINPTSSQTISAYQQAAASVANTGGRDGNTPIGGTIGRGDNSYSNATPFTPSNSDDSDDESSMTASSSPARTASVIASASSRASSVVASASSRASSVVASASSRVSSLLSSVIATQTGNDAAATQFPIAVAAIAGLAALL